MYNTEQAFLEKKQAIAMEKFYEKEYNKYNGLLETPKITKGLVEEYITFKLRTTEMLNFTRVETKPDTQEWKHSCLPTGVTVLQVVVDSLYNTPIYYMACPNCKSVNYLFETME